MAGKPVTTEDLREFFTKRNPNPVRALFEQHLKSVLGEFVTWIEDGKPSFVQPLTQGQRQALMGAKQAGVALTPDQEAQLASPTTPKGFA